MLGIRRRGFGAYAFAVVLLFLLVLGPAQAAPGGKIAFVRGGNIWTMDGAGGSQQQLTSSGTDSDPAFRADMTQIAFTRDGTIWSMSPDGSGATGFIPGAEPSWSPDGTEIAFSRDGDIWILDLTDEPPTDSNLTGALGLSGDSAPAWSSDGSKIAFSAGSDIYVVPADGGAAQRLTDSGGKDTSPAWSPDASKIAFVSKRDNNAGELYLMNADGNGETRLTDNSLTDASPSWSPDGSVLAFERDGAVWLMDPANAGAPPSQLPNGTQPDWGGRLVNTEPPSVICEDGSECDPAENVPDGEELSVNAGSWSSPGADPALSYQWLLCNKDAGSCVPISGATDITYEASSTDVGGRIRVRETASNEFGSASVDSDPTGVVVAAPPQNDGGEDAPLIVFENEDDEEDPPVGSHLSGDPGVWSGTEPMTFTYTWKRCDEAGQNCTNVGTGSAYTIQQGDVDHTIGLDVKATNSQGSATASAVPTEKVVSAVPVNVGPPEITPVTALRVGTILRTTNGIWNGRTPMTFTYQWQRCKPDKSGCVDIPGARLSSYTAVTADAGSLVAVKVTAKNEAGSSTAPTAFSAEVIAAAAPVNTVRPAITGTARVGSTLTVSNGTWTGTPTSFKYQWIRIDDDEDETDIVGATRNTYVPTSADLQHTLYVTVTATNAGGSTDVDTNETSTVLEALASAGTRPTNTALPRLSGNAAVGQTLIVFQGTWGGATPITYAYAWERCDAALRLCSLIPGATTTSRKLVAADLGKRLRARVTATNSLGSATATSAATLAVKAVGATLAVRRVVGSAKPNRLLGNAGRDSLIGLGGNDTLIGNAGNDILDGGTGNDRLLGGLGNDRHIGGTGNDLITPGLGIDTVVAGEGNDVVGAVDGVRDTIDCGAGRDSVVADPIDRVKNCEKVTRRKPPAAKRKTTSRQIPAVVAGAVHAARRV